MKKHCKTLSLQQLTAHQQRIRSIVRKINNYSPTFHINPNYNHSQIIQKIHQQRQEYENHLFKENMNIIEKLQSIGPKINTKCFPTVNKIARSKRKYNSLSNTKTKKSPPQKIYKRKDNDLIFQQNMQIIDKLQTIDKKIKCWQDKSVMKSRIIRQRNQKQKRNEILQKFKEISKQMKSLRPKIDASRISRIENSGITKTDNSRIIKHDTSRVRIQSPYFSDGKKRAHSQASFETKANSFMMKKTAK